MKKKPKPYEVFSRKLPPELVEEFKNAVESNPEQARNVTEALEQALKLWIAANKK